MAHEFDPQAPFTAEDGRIYLDFADKILNRPLKDGAQRYWKLCIERGYSLAKAKRQIQQFEGNFPADFF